MHQLGYIRLNMSEERNPWTYSIAELSAICHRNSAWQYDSYLGIMMRFFSIRITYVALGFGLHATVLSVSSVLIYFLGLGSFYFGTFGGNLLGAVLVMLSVAFDGSDGEIARFRNMRGPLGGHYIEPVSHDIQYGLGFLLVAVLLFLNGTGSVLLLVVGALAGLTKLMTRLLRIHWGEVQRALVQERSNDQAEVISPLKQAEDLIFENKFPGALELFKIHVGIVYRMVGGGEFSDEVRKASRMLFKQRISGWVEKNFFSSVSQIPLFFIGTFIGNIGFVLWYYAVVNSFLWVSVFARHIMRIRRDGLE